jgi:hypothetical protein
MEGIVLIPGRAVCFAAVVLEVHLNMAKEYDDAGVSRRQAS